MKIENDTIAVNTIASVQWNPSTDTCETEANRIYIRHTMRNSESLKMEWLKIVGNGRVRV